jgi:hypothetical protein
MVAHGSKALLAHVDPSDQGFARIVEKETFPAMKNGFWGRASFFTPIPAGSPHTDFVSVLAAGDQSTLEIGYYQGVWQLTFYPTAGGEMPQGSTTMVPRNAWVCLEFHIQRTAPLIEIFIDGGSVAQYMGNNLNVPEFTGLKLGYGNHSALAGSDEAYYDDFALDLNRIGCP